MSSAPGTPVLSARAASSTTDAKLYSADLPSISLFFPTQPWVFTSDLTGPNAHAYADLDDNDSASPSEDEVSMIGRSSVATSTESSRRGRSSFTCPWSSPS